MRKQGVDYGLSAPSNAAHTSDELSQLDRIERKLDKILAQLENPRVARG